MTTELGISSVNKEPSEHQSDDSKVEEPHAQYISAVVEAICRNQLATLKQWCMHLENLPRYKKDAIWTTCKTLPSFSNFNRNSFLQTIQSWEENPVRNMSSISVLYTAICFLQSEGMLPEIPPKGEPNYEYTPSMAKEFQSPSRDSTIPPNKQQYVQQSPVPAPSYAIPPQQNMNPYILQQPYGAAPMYPQMQPPQFMQNPQMHYQDPSQLHLPLPQQSVPMMSMQPMGMAPNGMPPMFQQNMNPYILQQPAYSQQPMIHPPQSAASMQGHALGACPGCRQVLKYPQAATIVRCPKCNTTLQPQQLQQQLQQQFPSHQVQMLHQQLQSGTLQVQPQNQMMQQQYMQPPSPHNNHSSRNVSTPNSSKNHKPPLQQQQQPMHQLPPPPLQQNHSSVNSLLNTPVITPSSFMPLAPPPNQMSVNPLNIPQMKPLQPLSSMGPNHLMNPPDFSQKLPLPKPWNNGSPQRYGMDNNPPPSLSPILNPSSMHSRQAVTHEIALDGTTKMLHPKPTLEKEQFAKKLRQDDSNGMEAVNVPLGSSQDRPILLEEPTSMRVEERVKEEFPSSSSNEQNAPTNMQTENEQQETPTVDTEKDSMVQSFFAESESQQQ